MKKESLMDAAKETIGMGIVSSAGLGAMGAMNSIPGMPAQAQGITTTVGAGLSIANIGRMAKTGMTVTEMFTNPKSSSNKKKTMF